MSKNFTIDVLVQCIPQKPLQVFTAHTIAAKSAKLLGREPEHALRNARSKIHLMINEGLISKTNDRGDFMCTQGQLTQLKLRASGRLQRNQDTLYKRKKREKARKVVKHQPAIDAFNQALYGVM